jgi:hypothetical protein
MTIQCWRGAPVAAALALLAVWPAGAVEIRPSTDVLVPYFEVVLDRECRTTLFSVVNTGTRPVDVVATVHTNWGVPMLSVDRTIPRDGTWTVNLKDWFLLGNLPERTLSAEELAHLQAALAGRQSPLDGRYYATDKFPLDDVAIGYVKVRVKGEGRRPRVLWGDYFIFCPEVFYVQGETLVDISPPAADQRLCERHAIRFLTPEALQGETELMIWTALRMASSVDPQPPPPVPVWLYWYREDGALIRQDRLQLLPCDTLNVGELDVPDRFGWVEVVTWSEAYVSGHYSFLGEYSSSLHAWCVPERAAPGPGVRLVKRVNGDDADLPPGPEVAVGSQVQFTFEVSNVGDEPLSGIEVTDDSGLVPFCPEDSLAPDASMECVASAAAVGCQHADTAEVIAFAPDFERVTDSNPGHYFGRYDARLGIEKRVNGEEADRLPGPELALGAPVTFTFEVVNSGDATLTGVAVTDSEGLAVSCPKTVLDPGESMVCSAAGVAAAGAHVNVGTASGTPPCGPAVSASDAAHYFVPIAPAIALEKATNGQDADIPPGPAVRVGDPVQWSYRVVNVGDVALTNVSVVDSRGVAVSCPKTVLVPAEAMTCTARGIAVAGQYANVGTASGTPPVGPAVSASDPSHYFGQAPEIQLEKLVNGLDADTLASAPKLLNGSAVLWSYVVVNTGDVALSAVAVTDDRGVAVSCPKAVLDPGESMICTGSGSAVAGQYTNVGTATGQPALGPAVSDDDPASYFGWWPQIDLEKLTNDQDADLPPGPTVLAGATVQWKYLVTNTGDVRLAGIVVTDDRGVAVSCPKTALDPSESMTCTASGTAAAGQYANLGTVTGAPEGGPTVSDTDPSHYFGAEAAIAIEKLTNGEDADVPPGPSILAGQQVLWTYVVTNSGTIRLANVTVTDSRGVTVTCPKTVLDPGESMTCTATGTAVAGQYSNVGTATGEPAGGSAVTASDPSHYKGWIAGNQGCTPGYWKNHTDSWPPTGYSPSQMVKTVFASVQTFYPTLDNATLWQALGFAGGPGGEGAAEILLRAAVAALLNASHPDIAYPRMEASVIADTNNALLQNRDAMLALAAALDADNNRGCPLH